MSKEAFNLLWPVLFSSKLRDFLIRVGLVMRTYALEPCTPTLRLCARLGRKFNFNFNKKMIGACSTRITILLETGNMSLKDNTIRWVWIFQMDYVFIELDHPHGLFWWLLIWAEGIVEAICMLILSHMMGGWRRAKHQFYVTEIEFNFWFFWLICFDNVA